MLQHTITAFKEYKHFENNKPWSVVKLTFPEGNITTPHYGETIEILLCDNIKGKCHIGGHHFDFCGRQVFFIAPNIIHSMTYLPSQGAVYVIKIYLTGLTQYLNLQLILKDYNLNFSDLPIFSPCLEETIRASNILSSKETNLFSALDEIINLFYNFAKTAIDSNQNLLLIKENDQIRNIIKWTETHYAQRFSIEDIADTVGYTKNYFCNKFKLETGITYIDYLNNVRVLHACDYLKDNSDMPLDEICENCGFLTTSYFIVRFKKIIGTTPHNYRKSFLKNM